MSGSRGGVGGKGNSNGGSIPQSSKKMIQSLKEIVNCPEAEIYAALKDCNMDPNETVDRLLSQDSFQEVKSKREKKKETKDATDSRSRGVSSTLNRGIRGGNDRYGHAILSQLPSSESGGLRTKPSYRKDNEVTNTSPSSEAGVVGNNMNWRSPGVSESPVENKAVTSNISDSVLSLHQSPGFQSPWLGVPGQKSMADIVKMGRPHARGTSNVVQPHQTAAHHHVDAFQFAPTPQELYSSQNYVAKVSEVDVDLVSGSQNVPKDIDWSQEKQPSNASVPLVTELPVISEPYNDLSRAPFDKTNRHLDEVQCVEDNEPDSRFIKMQNGSYSSVPIQNDELHDSIDSYQVHRDAYEQQEVDDVGVSVPSLATNIHQLSLSKEEEEEEEEEEGEEEEEDDSSSHERDSPSVKIPGYLQVQSAECSHLSFGSFGSGMGVPLSGNFASGPSKFDGTETSTTTTNAQSVGHSDARNSEYYNHEHLRTASGGNTNPRLDVSTGSYDMPSASQTDMLKQEANEVSVSPGNEYSFPSSPNYTFENSQHLNSSFSHSQISSQMQNLPQLSGIMSYSNSLLLPSSLLPSNTNQAREAEPSYSPFPITQSMPTKYGSSGSGNTTEALISGNLSAPQLTQNNSGSGISGGLTFPQHHAVHPYSQPSLPFANMVTYPLLHQNYAYMPSAFQQAIAGNSNYPQSHSAGMLPQYKNNVSASSLPQSANVPSGYGAFGNSNSIPGNFSLNPPPAVAPPASSMNYEDILSSQYRDAAHMLALQQFQGLGSRALPAVPGNTYYNIQGQTHHQPSTGYRQSQQQQLPSQQYGNHLAGYPNFYQSQSGVPLEHQQQMSREGLLAGSQGQQQQQIPKQSQQIWQNSY